MQVHHSVDACEQAVQMAQAVAARLHDAIAQRGRACLAVSGGRSPVGMFERLREQPLPWDRVTVVLVDERVVPGDHPHSNAALVHRHLLQGEAAHATWVPMLEASQRAAVAALAEAEEPAQAVPVLEGLAKAAAMRMDAAFDVVDVAVLGMGEDGHTASWFADDPRLQAVLQSRRAVEWVRAATVAQARLTLTPAVLLGARCLLLGLAGERKRSVFEQARVAEDQRWPVSIVLHRAAHLTQAWIAP